MYIIHIYKYIHTLTHTQHLRFAHNPPDSTPKELVNWTALKFRCFLKKENSSQAKKKKKRKKKKKKKQATIKKHT